MTNDDLQDVPICQVGMTFTEATSFRKVRLVFNCAFCFLWEITGNRLVQKGLQW